MKRPIAVELARQLVQELADAGMGVRETARIMGMSASHVAYYRARLGIKAPALATTDELVAALPLDLQRAVAFYRAERAA